MKKVSLFFISFFCVTHLALNAQYEFKITGIATKNLTGSDGVVRIKSDEELIITGINEYAQLLVESGVYKWSIKPAEGEQIDFDPAETVQQAWMISSIKSELYNNLSSKGYQYDLRNELDEESYELQSLISKLDLWFEDSYLEDYLQTLLYKIHPTTLPDNRPGNLNIKIIKSYSPNAMISSNGSIIITTGILSLIDSEDELTAILAHEIAHFVLDHHVININQIQQREKRALFWAGVATAIAAASEAYVASQDPYYAPGNLTLATAIISVGVANVAIERLGAKYSREQETEADIVATRILEVMGIDGKALSSALNKLMDYSIKVGDYYALSNEGTHPGLPKRIKEIGNPEDTEFTDPDYHQLISLVNTHTAQQEYYMKHFKQCDAMVQKNIDAGVALEEDYLLKAMVTRILFDTPDKNIEALEYIQKAKSIEVIPNSFIFKQEGLTLLRLNREWEAAVAFETYLKELEQHEPNERLLQEINWTKKMIYKIKVSI